MENSEDLFEERKIQQKEKVVDNSPVEENTAQDLFLTADERLNKILQSSVKIEIELEDPNEKDLEAVVKSTATKLGNTTLKSVAVKREVVEVSQNALTENETETFANEEIFKYIDDEEKKQDDYKLFNWKYMYKLGLKDKVKSEFRMIFLDIISTYFVYGWNLTIV